MTEAAPAPVVSRPRWSGVTFPRLGRNMIANGIGRAWAMLMSLVFVPFYINFLGIEAYGLIGFFATLMAVFSVLDLGLPTTLNRELARRAALADERATMRAVVRTLEIIYAGMGVVIGGAVFLLSGPIARDWLNSGSLPVHEVETAIRLIGLVIACQWPGGLYGGGLLGLQRQVTANLLMAGVMTLRGVGAIAVLAWVDSSLTAYFTFQALVSLAAVIAGRFILISSLPQGLARFDLNILKTVWKFAAGMMGVAIVTIALMQADKIILSAILPLEDYAHYVLAFTMGAAAGFIGAPIYTAIFPRFTELVSAGEDTRLRKLFHTQAQLIGAGVAALAMSVVMFAHELAYFWTRDASLAAEIAPMARLLAFGAALNAMMLVPHALTLAHGKAHYTLIANSIAASVIVPLVYVLAHAWGGVGAAFAWPLLNLGYVLIQAPIVLGLLMPGARWLWLGRGVALPLLAAGMIMLPVRLVAPNMLSPLSGFLFAGIASVAGLLGAGLLTSGGLDLARRIFFGPRAVLLPTPK